ncbi:MAG TPA: serine hydrolase domain-containing protein [Gemmatimonadaceae bacterium]|nr:serine hydrolase domain-containing protein [Gemmatimonadaceae bacterium]
MKYFPITLGAAFLAAQPAFFGPSVSKGATTDLTTQIDSIVQARIGADAFSGVVLVARNGGVIYQRAVGMANRETRMPMKMDTKLQIASMTKLFTQIAIQQLAQEGRLSLTDTVGKWLPGYPNATVRRKVTVDQLLHHRSGIGSFWNKRFLAEHSNVRTTRDYMNLFENDSLLFEPGTNQAYSNGGYVLLGAIIERVTGEPYHAYVRHHILEPAGMTGTAPYDSRVTSPDAAIGYTRQDPGQPGAADQRLAGPSRRPGDGTVKERTPSPQPIPPIPDSSAGGAPRLLIIGPDGRQLSPDEARAAVARHNQSKAPLAPNTAFEAGVSGPAGDDFSTAPDLLRLATALTSHRLLDSAHTNAVLGSRFTGGGEFRANGGGPGVNAEFSIYPTGEVIVAISNYDPPAATAIAESIRSLIGSSAATTPNR